MLQHVLTDKVVLQKWLKAGYMENGTLFSREAGKLYKRKLTS